MKFLIDMQLSPNLAAWLNAQGHDAIHASDAGLACAADREIVETARAGGSVVVTADLDYPRLLALSRLHQPGLVLFRGGKFGEEQAISYLRRVLDSIPPDIIVKSLVVVEPDRIRRRDLPVV